MGGAAVPIFSQFLSCGALYLTPKKRFFLSSRSINRELRKRRYINPKTLQNEVASIIMEVSSSVETKNPPFVDQEKFGPERIYRSMCQTFAGKRAAECSAGAWRRNIAMLLFCFLMLLRRPSHSSCIVVF